MWVTVLETEIYDFRVLEAATRDGFAEVERLLNRPAETAARERLNRGINAFGHQWFDEAQVEFQAAVDGYPYWPDAQTLLGVSRILSRDEAAAWAALQLAVRYAEGASESMQRWGATAALLASGLSSATTDERLALVRQADLVTGELCLDLAWLRTVLGESNGGLTDRLKRAAQTQRGQVPDAALSWLAQMGLGEAIEAPLPVRDLSPATVKMHEDRIAAAHSAEERRRLESAYKRVWCPPAQPLRPFLVLLALVNERTS